MSTLANRVRRSFYADSVALMRIARELSALEGVQAASLMIGTPSNQALLAESGLLAAEGRTAKPDDLVIAVRASGAAQAARALEAAERLLTGGESARAATGVPVARRFEGGIDLLPDANLALISVPGEYAAAEARRALERGLHVMMFSDNVPVEEEVALKQLAVSKGLLMMGPDCGTCHIGGAPLAFANAVPVGDIGLVSASGTGLQAIGVGGRDLSEAVGGLMTLAAFEMLDADPKTKTIVLISKPPSPQVAAKVFARVARSRKRVVLCLLGTGKGDLPRSAAVAGTLLDAALAALGKRGTRKPPSARSRKGWLRGLFCGGTLCAEAQLILQAQGLALQSNAAVPGATESGKVHAAAHTLIDLGDDDYTRGRPHPMIDPEIRNELLVTSLRDASVGVVLLDVVIGHGAHPDPAGLIAAALAKVPGRKALVLASVTGTEADPQVYSRQVEKLREAGVVVARSNAEAALAAARALADHSTPALRRSSSGSRSARAGTAPRSAGTRRRRDGPAGRSGASRRGKR
jgi:FdrA protein